VTDLQQHFVVAFEDSFDARYGLEYLSPTHGRLTVEPAVLGADGTVQSGIYAAMAESLASTGTAVEVVPKGYFPSGLSNATHVVGEARDGILEGVARCRSQGEGEWVWDVEIGLPGAPPTAVATVVIAVRKLHV
jgi:acyl-coenzyme A thioesterase PaaI-like protein